MVWLRIDDTYPDHPKVIGLSDIAFRLHVTATCYATRYLTDGFVPEAFVKAWRKKGLDAAKELIAANLFEERPFGWMVHDFHDYNPTSDEIKEKRRVRAEAGRRGGLVSASKRASSWQANAQAESKHREPTPVPSPSPSPDRYVDHVITTRARGDEDAARKRAGGTTRGLRGVGAAVAGIVRDIEDRSNEG